MLYVKPSIPFTSSVSSSRIISTIPKPHLETEYSYSVPTNKFHQFALMNVPMMLKKVRNSECAEVEFDDGEDDEMMLPH